jgi:hypothetical protein
MEKEVNIKEATNDKKLVVFLPMHHIGRESFYADVSRRIDSLRKLHFQIYFEAVKPSAHLTLEQKDTLNLKMRKIIGIDFISMRNNGGYIDTLNGTVNGIKMKAVKKYGLVNQPKPHQLKIDTTKDKQADLYMLDLLNEYERKFGKVVLDECDYANKPGTKYHCKKLKRKNATEVILAYRNMHIANEVINDTSKKIAIVYGGKHFKGIVKNLQLQDPSWRIIP